MLKKLNLDEFYTDENKKLDGGAGIGAVGLLTPHQFVKVLNYEAYGVDGLGSHDGTYMFLLNDIYGLDAPLNKKGFPDMSVVTSKIPNGKKNFVFMDFVVQNALDFVTVNIPKYITPYQYEELEKLSEELKKYDITKEVVIYHYDPLKVEYERSIEDDKYYSEENSISLALQYLKDNNRILDYELPFGEEKIIEQKKNHL